MITISWNNGSINVEPSDDSYLYKQIQGDNNIQLVFETAEYTEIPLGATIEFLGEEYTLCVPATIEKTHTRSFKVTATFESYQYSLKKYTVKECVYNESTQQWDSNRSGSMRFSLTATAKEHVQLIVDNLNKREGVGTWSIDTNGVIDSSEKLVSYDYTLLSDALATIAQTFDTEWYIDGHKIGLKKLEFDKTDPLSLSYGKGNGFKSGVGRTNFGDVMPIEVLNVQGTDRNIDYSKYNAKYLLLPKGITFYRDDNGNFSFNGRAWLEWNAEDGRWETIMGVYTPLNPQAYITTDDGLQVSLPTEQQKTKQEANYDGTNVYPSRVCTVTSVQTEQQSGQTLYNIIDSTIPYNLNFADCVIAGQTPTIVFQSGMLAGREFSFDATTGYVHSNRMFKIVNEEIDGMIMPEPNAFYPQVGDKFIVFGIELPDAYLSDDTTHTGASYDLLREAVNYLHENKNSKYTFSGELDGIYAKNNWQSIGTKLRLGEYVSFTDSNFQSTAVLIRIIGLKQYINNPYSPEIEMSNESVGSTLIGELKKIKAQEVVTETLQKRASQQTLRNYNSAKQTSEALNNAINELGDNVVNFTKGITPVSVQTMQMIVGTPNLQFNFGNVSNGRFNKETISVTSANNRVTIVSNGTYLMHYTLSAENVISSTTNTSSLKVWKMNTNWQSGILDADKQYYVYAKVSRTASGTVGSLPTAVQAYECSETSIGIESVTGYYYLLIGILNAEVDGSRSFAEMFGFTEILPQRITTDKIMSADGQGVVIDLANGTITGNITLQSGNASNKAIIDSIIGVNPTVSGAVSTAQTASANASSAVTTAGQANATANNAHTLATSANTKIDNLEVGGRNILLNSADTTKVYYLSMGTLQSVVSNYAVAEWGATDAVQFNVVASGTNAHICIGGAGKTAYTTSKSGAKYTASFWIKNTQATNPVRAKLNFGTASELIMAGESRRVILTGEGNGSSWVQLNFEPQVAGMWQSFVIWHVKIEEGTIATDWTPAPEDTDEYIAENGIEGTCTAQASSETFTYPINAPRFKSSYLKKGLKLKVLMTYANRKQYYSSLAINGGTSKAVIWQGSTSNKPIWDTNDIVEFIYNGSNWYIADEEQRLLREVYSEAIQGATSVNGGLILTKLVQCGEGNSQAGVSGVRSHDVAFWAGGSPTSANTPVRIFRNGQAFFGRLFLKGTKGNIGFNDDSGNEMWELISDNVPSDYAQHTFSLNDVSGHSTSITGTSVSNDGLWYPVGSLYTISGLSRSRGAKLTFKMSGTVSNGAGALSEVAVGIVAGTATPNPQAEISYLAFKTMAGQSSATFDSTTYTFNFPYSTTDYYYLVLFARSETAGTKINASMSVSNLVGTSVNMMTTMGKNGMLIAYNASNYFTAFIANGIMNVKAHGNFDLPGVLFAGEASEAGAIKPIFKNSAVNVSLSSASGGVYTYTITGATNVLAMAIPFANSTNNYRCAISAQSSTSVTVRCYNGTSASTAFGFNLILIGTT